MRATICVLSMAGLMAGCLVGCKQADQPAKPAGGQTEKQGEKQTAPVAPASVKAEVGGTVTNEMKSQKKESSGMSTATVSSSPLISKHHTPTTACKKMMEASTLPSNLQVATFGAGCFWGVESTFRKTAGVLATSVGYSGGKTVSPTYKQVCEGGSGHAEVVDVVYDPAVVSYEALLGVFFANHNPTQVNRQGPDVGDQYRTVVFYHDEAQKAAAEKAKADLDKSGKWNRPIATQVVKFEKFWAGEEYHQTYLEKRGLDVCH